MKSFFSIYKNRLPKFFVILSMFIVVYGIFVRSQDLGYSNYQGDEINTVDFIYEMKNGVISYLFEQKRGPTQYLLNMLNVSLFGYSNEFQIRLPYLVFGILSLLSFYLLSKKLFGKNTAIFTVIILSLNGLFIAFSRITQYQSLMYLTITTATFVFLVYVKSRSRKRFLVISGILMSIALISHYDALSVMPFFLVLFFRLAYEDYKSKQSLKSIIADAVIFFALMFIPALFFYIPFLLGSGFENKTSSYLGDRLLGGGLMPRTKHITMLISMYIPTPVLQSFYFFAISTTLFFVSKLKNKFVKIAYFLLFTMNLVGSILSLYDFKPRSSTVLVLISSVLLVLLFLFASKVSKKYVAVLSWAIGCYCFYFFLMKDARTHVYVSMIPTMILSGYFLSKIYSHLRKKYKYILILLISFSSILWSGFNWTIFVDKSPEYPFFDKYYLGKLIYDLPRWRPKKIDGVFGFNNWRGWEIVASEFSNGCLSGTYDSNEKNSITYFYMKKNQLRYENLLGYLPDGQYHSGADNIILVEGPHSWEYLEPGYKDTLKDYDLVKTIYSKGIPVTYIYSKSYKKSCFQ